MSRECNGICVMGWELIEGASGVAYPHPECDLHGPNAGRERCPEADADGWQCVFYEDHNGPCGYEDPPPVPNPDAPYVWGDPPTEVPF